MSRIAGSMIAILVVVAPAAADEGRFAGFPTIGKTAKGEKSTKVIASDPAEGLLRPKWTRAMADLGSSVNLFRYRGDIYFVHGAGDGHRGAAAELKNKRFIYVSQDEGKTWKLLPQPPGAMFGKYVMPVGERLYDFGFEDGCTCVQTSDDGVKWTPKQKVYKAPYWLYGVNYDPISKMFWCAAQSMAVGEKPDGSWILRDVHLVKSQDAIHWEHVSTLPIAHVNISEAALRFEPDRTMSVIVRRKWSGDSCTLAVAKPPYTQWEVSTLPEVAEGHSFFEAGGQVFLGSRAYYRDDIPEIRANKSLRYVSADGVAYTVIHRFTKDRKLVAWAVVDSMGDCSYPRFVETPTEILVAYYSEHEDNICKPYLAAFDKRRFLAPIADTTPDSTKFPPIGKVLPGKRSVEVITSDAVTAGLRPKWTRAMADGGSPVELYRFRGALHYLHGPGDAQREGQAGMSRYVSTDEGRAWKEVPAAPGPAADTYSLSANDKLFRYAFDGAQTWVRTSDDGVKWTRPEKAYKPPFRLYGVVHDPASKLYWCAAHFVPGKVPGEREVHLIRSKDGVRWDYVSTVATSGVPKVGEAAMHFEPDRTALVAFCSNTASSHFRAVSRPPYKDWQLSELPDIAEGHFYFTAGGRTFLASRAKYVGDNAAVKKNSPYVAIYRLVKSRELQFWAVLDSMGECGQPRLVETPTGILCAYYSQHQDGVRKPFLAAFDKTEFLRKR
jgi:hypothetical protein